MSIVFADREAAYPHKYKIIPEDGGDAYYAVLERADEPLTPGTPLNAETFNKLVEDYEKLISSHTDNKENPHGITVEQIGARANTWVPTPAEIGAAPSGFGYGETMVWLGFNPTTWTATNTFQDDLEAVFAAMPQGTCKQVQFVDSNLNTQKFTGTLWKYTEDYGHLSATNYSSVMAVKTLYNKEWGPWEWVTPPMANGVEYRTTERHLGKVVYAVAFDFGALPNNSSKYVQIPYKTPKIVSVSAVATSTEITQIFPSMNFDDGHLTAILQVRANYSVGFKSFTGMSHYTAKITVKYTKN